MQIRQVSGAVRGTLHNVSNGTVTSPIRIAVPDGFSVTPDFVLKTFATIRNMVEMF